MLQSEVETPINSILFLISRWWLRLVKGTLSCRRAPEHRAQRARLVRRFLLSHRPAQAAPSSGKGQEIDRASGPRACRTRGPAVVPALPSCWPTRSRGHRRALSCFLANGIAGRCTPFFAGLVAVKSTALVTVHMHFPQSSQQHPGPPLQF